MKLSLKWIIDHFVSFPPTLTVQDIVHMLNKSTAEVEISEHIVISDQFFRPVIVEQVASDHIVVKDHSNGTMHQLPLRIDLVEGQIAVLCIAANGARWAELKDVGSNKDGFFGPIVLGDKESLLPVSEYTDTILEVDNKSITHRPDLWCHRGFARELAALFSLELVPMDQLLQPITIVQASGSQHTDYSIKVDMRSAQSARRLAVCDVPAISWRHSSFFIAQRLAKVDARPIDALVDLTNYVMFDIGQPMHAFDRTVFASAPLVVKQGEQGKKIALLDGTDYTLHADDTIVASGTMPVSLAGVMGGKLSGISAQTTGIVLEAASFDPTAIRLAAARAKVRSESSARFEKSLDPLNPPLAIARYLKLLEQENIEHKATESIIVLGPAPDQVELHVEHDFIERRLGVSLQSDFIKNALSRLGFEVACDNNIYRIIVPSFRATKDISRPEDIVEEIGRMYGYDRIEPHMPQRQMAPFALQPIRMQRLIEDLCAYSLCLRQVVNYPFFDEEFLQRLKWEPVQSIRAKHPMSLNLTRLINSLVPHLIKNVAQNAPLEEQLGFFEINKQWHLVDQEVFEQRVLALCWWHKTTLDFYTIKAELNKIATALGVTFSYRKPVADELSTKPWFDRYQTAHIIVDKTVVGTFGMLNQQFHEGAVSGVLAAAELDYQTLIGLFSDHKHLQPISKFPRSWFDVSLLLPFVATVDEFKAIIQSVDSRIVSVELRDYFEHPSWKDKRSVTLRYVIRDFEKTLTTVEIDDIWNQVIAAVQSRGATVR